MVTKDQAMNCMQFIQIAEVKTVIKMVGLMQIVRVAEDMKDTLPLSKTIAWRANGKCQTWKTRPEDFKLPVKHGLYTYGYITQDNAHLFTVKE